MPNLSSLVTTRADNNPLFSSSVENVEGYPYGISYNNGWSVLVDSPRILSTIITIPGLVSNTPMSCSVQIKTRTAQNILDTQTCWLMSQYATGNSLYLYLSGGGTGTNGGPVDNANFGISWEVVGDPTP